MAVAVGFRDHLVGDHEDHRASRQAHAHRVGDGKTGGNPQAYDCADWLHQPGADRYQGGFQRRKPRSTQGQGHGQAFRNVLNGDGTGQR
ncbi:hypothetical protein D3C72_2177620 [compost metagenome]